MATIRFWTLKLHIKSYARAPDTEEVILPRIFFIKLVLPLSNMTWAPSHVYTPMTSLNCFPGRKIVYVTGGAYGLHLNFQSVLYYGFYGQALLLTCWIPHLLGHRSPCL